MFPGYEQLIYVVFDDYVVLFDYVVFSDYVAYSDTGFFPDKVGIRHPMTITAKEMIQSTRLTMLFCQWIFMKNRRRFSIMRIVCRT